MISRSFFFKQLLLMIGATLFAGLVGWAQLRQSGSGVPSDSQTAPGTQQQPGATTPGMNDNSSFQSMNDREFVRETLEGGMIEVQLGRLAVQKASSNDVKQFGQKMVDDHTKLGNAMSQVAQQVGVQPPKGISKKDKELIAKLQDLSGSEFDDAYIRAMIKDHKKDDSAFKMEAEQAENPAVKQIARQGEPVIAGHLQMILEIAQAHNIESGKSKKNGL